MMMFSCLCMIYAAQAMDKKEQLKNDIRQYVGTLHDQVNEIGLPDNFDSIKIYAAGIHTQIDSFFDEIRQVYEIGEKDMQAAENLGVAYAMNSVAAGSGGYYQVNGIDKFINQTDNKKYFKRLAKISRLAEKLETTNSARKANKFKELLGQRVADLYEMSLL